MIKLIISKIAYQIPKKCNILLHEQSTMTGAIRDTSKGKLYQELGLESLPLRRWYRNLCYLFKDFKNQSQSYLFNVIPKSNCNCQTRNCESIPKFKFSQNFFKNFFFSSAISEWSKLDKNNSNSDNISTFKTKTFLDLFRIVSPFVIIPEE